jgi:hypothetical protein
VREPNPYQSPAIPPETPATPAQRRGEDALYFAAQWHNIVGGLGLLFAIATASPFIYFILDPSTRGSDARRTAPQYLAICAWMGIQSLLMLAGGISMHQHKRRWLAIIGAWAGIMPFCGCYVFSLISGIWALVVLQRPEVKALFVVNQQANPSVVDTPSGEAT